MNKDLASLIFRIVVYGVIIFIPICFIVGMLYEKDVRTQIIAWEAIVVFCCYHAHRAGRLTNEGASLLAYSASLVLGTVIISGAIFQVFLRYQYVPTAGEVLRIDRLTQSFCLVSRDTTLPVSCSYHSEDAVK